MSEKALKDIWKSSERHQKKLWKTSEKALKNIRKLSYPDRDTHVPRSGYACISVGVHMYLGRGTMTMKHFWDDFRVKRKRQTMWKGKNKPLALFLKTIFLKLFACEVFKDNRDNRDNIFYFWTLAFMIWNLKQALPKAANIHNRWWRERSERNLRFHSKKTRRPRRGRT